MKKMLLSKQNWTIVTGEEVIKVGVPEEAKLSHLNRTQNAVSKITMAVSDHCLGSTADTGDPDEQWNEDAQGPIFRISGNYY